MCKALTIAFCALWLLASAHAAQTPKPQKTIVAVSIKDRQFSPADLTIKTGHTVRWTNADNMDHSVDAKDGSFSSGTIKSKKTYEYSFSKKGKYPYSCKLHPRMKGTITVE